MISVPQEGGNVTCYCLIQVVVVITFEQSYNKKILKKQEAAMKITWLGHSCFKVETRGYVIVLDPYEDGSVPGCEAVRETADEVLCSHEH